MNHRNVKNSQFFEGRIDQKVHSVNELRSEFDNWDEKSKSEKLSLTRSVEPDSMQTSYNVTTNRLHQYFVDNLDRENTTTQANVSAEFVGLGVDNTNPVTSNTDLNTRVYEQSITDVADNGKDLLASSFVGSTDANDNVLNEIGLFTGDPNNTDQSDVFMMNHATFSPVTKDNTKTVTFDVTLTFSDN